MVPRLRSEGEFIKALRRAIAANPLWDLAVLLVAQGVTEEQLARWLQRKTLQEFDKYHTNKLRNYVRDLWRVKTATTEET